MARFADRRSPEAFRAYLKKTVLNLTRSHHRREGLRRSHLLRAGQASSPSVMEPSSGSSDLNQLLLLMPHRQRAAIVLRYYEDLSESETARLLGCSEGAVRSAVFRGMQHLRQAIEGQLDEP
jgi:RNA polymerase sigma factor (sigma-70 family)